MVTFLGLLAIVGFLVFFLSIVKVYFYLKNKGKDVVWGGAGLIGYLIEYYELTKLDTGKVGPWFKIFFVSFLSMMCAIVAAMIIS